MGIALQLGNSTSSISPTVTCTTKQEAALYNIFFKSMDEGLIQPSHEAVMLMWEVAQDTLSGTITAHTVTKVMNQFILKR